MNGLGLLLHAIHTLKAFLPSRKQLGEPKRDGRLNKHAQKAKGSTPKSEGIFLAGGA